MNESMKVKSHHLERDAYLYIRQSSIRQVLENTESGKRQYALRTRAIALGWPNDRIVVIDSDQGESGASTACREGFQLLVTQVGMGRVGIVMGLEVSRLARNSADWHRLLEICAFADTLILDEDGVYDPNHFNDRLLLGLKGTMSEAELHILKARLRGGILSKVRRGEFRCALPTGLVYDDLGKVILDPNSQIRETIAHFFETFSRVGSAHQTVKSFNNEGIKYPSRVWSRQDQRVIFRPLTASAAIRTLHNPRYAGVYAFGRRSIQRSQDGKKILRNREQKDWIACIPNAHPGYITWERYQENIRLLQANSRGYGIGRNSPPREGSALLQGRAICGVCGRYFRVRYRSSRRREESWYICDRASNSLGKSHCQSIAGPPIDRAIGLVVIEKVTPKAIELTLEVYKEIQAQQQKADQLRCRSIERAQYESDLAQRRFMKIDPDNRLVADILERDWNEKLSVLANAREEREQALKKDKATIDDVVSEQLITMATDFKLLWESSKTPNRERKRMLACIIEDVTLLKLEGRRKTKIHIRYKGGKTETIIAQNPKSPAEQCKTVPKILTLVDNLLDKHIYSEIAEILNEQGLKPGGSNRRGREKCLFNAKRVAFIATKYKLQPRYDRLRARGFLTRKELAELLGIHEQTVTRWAKYGLIKKHAYDGYRCLYEDPGPNPPVKHSSRWDTLVDRAEAKQTNEGQNTSREQKGM
jgi:DNA invertase Pin-like site-specific DNA recombinase